MSRQATRAVINQILKSIGENGLSGVHVTAKSAPDALTKLSILPIDPSPQRHYQLVNELKRQELVTISRENDDFHLQLSVKGIHRLQRAEIESLSIKKPAIWDKKWRLVMFDIPSHKNESRYILTSNLKRLGFRMIQKSFWVHPYPCFDIAEKVILYANLQNYISLAEISRLDAVSERRLLRHFKDLV